VLCVTSGLGAGRPSCSGVTGGSLHLVDRRRRVRFAPFCCWELALTRAGRSERKHVFTLLLPGLNCQCDRRWLLLPSVGTSLKRRPLSDVASVNGGNALTGVTCATTRPSVQSSVRTEYVYRASHVRFIFEFLLYATKNTNYADHLIPFIMFFNLVINVGM
jgi:hypothetical protein